MKNGTASRFDLQHGTDQGRPISPYLFLLLCFQILTTHIINSATQGVSIADRDVIIS